MKTVLITTAQADYMANMLDAGLRESEETDVQVFYDTPIPELALVDADWIILTTGNGVPPIDLKRHRHKVAIVDGADERWKTRKNCPCAAYFKREAYLDDDVIPFSFAAGRKAIPQLTMAVGGYVKRPIDVFFAAHIPSNQIRRQIYDRLKAFGIAHGYAVMLAGADNDPRLSPKEYIETMRASKIFISARGSGQDTNNYWEASPNGTLLVAQRRTIRINNNFVGGEEACFFDTVDEMEIVLTELLTDPKRMAKVASQGMDRAWKHHWFVPRANELLAELSSRVPST